MVVLLYPSPAISISVVRPFMSRKMTKIPLKGLEVQFPNWYLANNPSIVQSKNERYLHQEKQKTFTPAKRKDIASFFCLLYDKKQIKF